MVCKILFWIIIILYIYISKESLLYINQHLLSDSNKLNEHDTTVNIIIIFTVIIPIIIPHITRFFSVMKEINKEIKLFTNL